MCDQLQFRQTLRAKPFVRPKPLRRGEGVGGGNYVKHRSGGYPLQERQSISGTNFPVPRRASTSGRSSKLPPRPASASTPSTSAENVCPAKLKSSLRTRPSSAPTTSGRRSLQSPFKPVECEFNQSKSRSQKSGSPRPESFRRVEFEPDSSRPGPSRVSTCESPMRGVSISRSPTADLSRADQFQSCPSPQGSVGRSSKVPRDKSGTPKRSSPRGSTKKSLTSSTNTSSRTTSSRQPTSVRPSSAVKLNSKANAQRPQSAEFPVNRRNPPSANVQPGPSCLRPPPSGGKRKLQFSGVPPSTGLSPDSRSKYMPKRERAVYGPSLYPIFPGQYEVPFRSLPGPKQILLMPGDINPNETTIIDIMELDEGDIQQVPFIPPHAPASLLEDSRRAQEEARVTAGDERKSVSRKRLFLKKNTPSDNMAVGEGRPFPAGKYGNITGKDLPIPMYKGPSYSRPDPECAREMPFRSRKTVVRPFLDEERIALEQAKAFRAMRQILMETDARIQEDRAARGLGDDDLIDIDIEVATPTNVYKAPRDIFQRTDECKFPNRKAPLTPPEKMLPECPINYQTDDLIKWDDDDDDDVVPYDQSCEPTDYFNESSANYPSRRVSTSASPMLMEMDEPEEDLLGLYTPPAKPRCPTPQPDQDDLIQWKSPVGCPLPYDEGFEDGNLFDAVTKWSPKNNNPMTPPLSNLREPANYKEFMLVCQPQYPSTQGETRIVRAVPLGNDPNTVVLESSPLARGRESGASGECPQNTSDQDESFGLLDNVYNGDEPWLTEENFEEQFHKRRPGTARDLSNVQPSVDCNDGLGLINDDWDDLEFDHEVDVKFRAQAKYQTIFQPLAEGGGLLDEEMCPLDYELEQVGQDFEKEFADFLHLEHEPDVSPRSDRQFGRLGTELIDECKCPVEEYTDLLGLYSPGDNRSSQRREGPYTKELLDECPEEQQLIDFSEECSLNQPEPPQQFGYSRDLFTNVRWDPSMAPNPKMKNADDECRV